VFLGLAISVMASGLSADALLDALALLSSAFKLDSETDGLLDNDFLLA
jgi:hypothetical protein